MMDVATGLKEKRHNVWIVANPESKIGEESKSRNLNLITFYFDRYFNVKEITNFVKTIRGHNIDIIHTHFSRNLWSLVPASLFKRNSRVVLTKSIGSYIKKKDPLHRFLYSRVSAVTVLSEDLKRNVLRTTTMTWERVVVIHPGISLNKSPSKSKISIRKELHIPSHSFVVGNVARIDESKGQRELILAGIDVIREIKNVVFLFVGGERRGEYFEGLQNMIKGTGLKEHFIFTGFRKDITNILSAMDLFVFPSRAEVFGIALVEAMAQKLPCIATNSGALPEIITDNHNGLLFNREDHIDLKEKILSLIKDRRKRKILAQNAKKSVEKFSIERTIVAYENLYYNILR